MNTMRRFVAWCVLVAAQVASYSPSAHANDALLAVYQTGCDGGDALQCNALGMELERSSEAPADRARAAAAFEKACDGGSLLACVNAGDLYMSGIGIAKDPKRAETLYRLACDRKVREVDACGRLANATTASAAQVANTSAPKTAGAAPDQSRGQPGPPHKADFFSLLETPDAEMIAYLDKASIQRSPNGVATFDMEEIYNGSLLRKNGYKVQRFRSALDCPRRTLTVLEWVTLDDQLRAVSHATKPGAPIAIKPQTNGETYYEAVCRADWSELSELMNPNANGEDRMSIADATYDVTRSRLGKATGGAAPSGPARDPLRRTDFWLLGEDKVEKFEVLIDKSTIRPGNAGTTNFLLEFISPHSDRSATGQPVSGYLVSRYQASVDCAHNLFSASGRDEWFYHLTKDNDGWKWSGKLLVHGPSDLPSGPIEPGTPVNSAYDFVCRKLQDPRYQADSHDENADLEMAEVLLDTSS